MTMTEKMLTQNGVKPKAASSQNNDNNGGQAGAGAGGGGGVETDTHNADGSLKTPNANAGANTGGGAAASQGAGGGNGGGAGAAASTPLSVEALLKGLEEQGIKVASIEELRKPAAEPTPQEKEQLEIKRRNEIRSHALTTGKVQAGQLDAYAVESALPTADLALAIYKRNRLAELKAANTPEDQIPTDKDLQTEFSEINFLNVDENDPRRKAAEKRLQQENDFYLQETYPAIYEMESDYEETVENKNLRTGYTSTLNEVFTALPREIPFTVKDNDKDVSIPVKFSDAEIAAVRATFDDEKMFGVLGKNKATKDAINEAVMKTLKVNNIDRIINDVANTLASQKIDAAAKGRRNIFNNTGGGHINTDKKVTPGVGKILQKAGVKPVNN